MARVVDDSSQDGKRMTDDAIPVTLLSGFLGSGKTTLLKHILRSDHGLRIAVIVNDIGAINVDASLIKQTHRLMRTEEKVVELQNGCICCTLRGDLLEKLVELSEMKEFDYVIIESSGISEPEQVAETFDARLADHLASVGDADNGQGLDQTMLDLLRRLKKSGGLSNFARLDTTVTVIDAFSIFRDFDTDEMLSARREDVEAEDERTVSDLMVDQIEFADVIVLNKMDMIDNVTRDRVIELVKSLNHRASIIQATHGRIDVNKILNTGLFNLELAQTGYGWLQDLHDMTVREVNGKKTVTPKPETEEYNVRNFVYHRSRPFHPERLYALIHDKFLLQHPAEESEDGDDQYDQVEFEEMDQRGGSDSEWEGIDDDIAEGEDVEMEDGLASDDTPPTSPDRNKAVKEGMDLKPPPNEAILTNKRASPLFSRLFRSKGEYFLATRPDRAGEWSQAGAMLTLGGGRRWFCTLPESEYLTGSKEIDELVQHDIAKGGEWGDRHQELVFIGERLDIPGLTAALDACLLDDVEWKKWCQVMRSKRRPERKIERLWELFDDGFPDWAEEDGGVDHGSHEHRH